MIYVWVRCPFPGVGTRHPFRWGKKRRIHHIPSVVNNNRADVKITVATLLTVSRERLVFLSTGTSRTPDSQTPGSRTAVYVLMGEKRKKCLERRNLTESTIVRRSIGLPVLFESCRGSAHTRP
ncbi:hypothetical protein TNCV_3912371 [Trichonephila clavipes]|nr:hypothetical protein TNCV_3912371 [Trichonephila clavipes]